MANLRKSVPSILAREDCTTAGRDGLIHADEGRPVSVAPGEQLKCKILMSVVSLCEQ